MAKRATDEQKAEVRQLRNKNLSYNAICRATGAPKTSVARWLNLARDKLRRASRISKRSAYYDGHKAETTAWKAVYYTNHKKRLKALQAAWKHKYSDKCNASNAARRALKAGAIVGATIAQLAEISEIYRRAKDDSKVRCYLCGKLIPMGHRHVDHIVPLSKGGAHRASNLAAACDKCNLEKWNKMPEEIGMLI